MLSCGPNAAAWAFIAAGLGTCHRPVARRFSSVCTAVIVSAGVNAQCPARCTKTWRSRLARPAVPAQDLDGGGPPLVHGFVPQRPCPGQRAVPVQLVAFE